LIVLSTVLRIRRALNGEEIDDLIADTCAGFELAADHRSRTQWKNTMANAYRFTELTFHSIAR
jgi:hypothetical protein